MKERDALSKTAEHYSDKGSHKARSDYWKGIRRLQVQPQALPNGEAQWLMRKAMLRDPRSGRR
jgi:hypothetical protein